MINKLNTLSSWILITLTLHVASFGSGCSTTKDKSFDYEAHYQEMNVKVALIRATSCMIYDDGNYMIDNISNFNYY